jgi:hypothetical protein
MPQLLILLTNSHKRLSEFFVLLRHVLAFQPQLPQLIAGVEPQRIVLFFQLHFFIEPGRFSLGEVILYFVELFLHLFAFKLGLFPLLFVEFGLLLEF